MPTRIRWTVYGRWCGHIVTIVDTRAEATRRVEDGAAAGLTALRLMPATSWDSTRAGKVCRMCTVQRPKPPRRRHRGNGAATLTRSPQWRAGTRANKHRRTVPTFASDRKAARAAVRAEKVSSHV